MQDPNVTGTHPNTLSMKLELKLETGLLCIITNYDKFAQTINCSYFYRTYML